MTTVEKLSQSEIEALQKEFGTGAVADYFKIADHVADRRIGAAGIAAQIEAGTEKIKAEQLELKRTVLRMHGKGESPSDIADKLNIGIGMVYSHIGRA